MRRTLSTALAALLAFGCAASPAAATSRIKDLASIEGVRQNQLIGYGLVVGLNGTGDTLNNTPFTKQSLQAMLERLGVNIRGQTIRTGNVAAVMVTANLPPFATQGTRIDVTASAMGDSKSLEGGTLLVTPLLGADGNVYAVAQGSLSIGGFTAQGAAASITRGVPTVGRMPNGAIVEREIEFALNSIGQLRLALRNPDFTTAKRIAIAVNDYIGAPVAEPLDPSTVQLTLPKKFPQNVVAMLTEIEQLQVEPDEGAKIVIDERSGVIVIGRDVRVSTVAVAQGNLTVTISETPQVSQPAPFSRGRTVVVTGLVPVLGFVCRCSQKVVWPGARNSSTLVWFAPTARATALSQSLPAAQIQEPALAGVSVAVGAPVEPEAAMVAPATVVLAPRNAVTTIDPT